MTKGEHSMSRMGFVIMTAVAIVAGAAPGLAQGPREGIVVHGNWTLEVRNRDGSLAERRQFENSLFEDGGKVLAQVLGRERSMGFWTVKVLGGIGGARFGPSTDAWLLEPNDTLDQNAGAVFKNLKVGFDSTFGKLVLRGSVTPTGAGYVTDVLTSVKASCLTPECTTRDPRVGSSFTGTQIRNDIRVPTPLHLEVDQTLVVTVTISFTSPAGS
jgi:hypothetical protein